MTWEELSELEKTGLFDIQSHSYWHPNFNTEKQRLTPAQYEELVTTQLAKSRQAIETKLHTRVDLLAWPFGIVDEFLMMKAEQAGYIAGFALANRQVSRNDPVMALPRYPITDADIGRRFQRILRTLEDDPNSTYVGKVTNRLTAATGSLVTSSSASVQIAPAVALLPADQKCAPCSYRLRACSPLLELRKPGECGAAAAFLRTQEWVRLK